MLTPKQEKLIELIKKNLAEVGERKTLGEIMLEAGYSKSQSENPHAILSSEAIQEGISDFIGSLDDKRKQAITHITEDKLKKSSARDVAYIVDVLNKNHQVLTGGKTGEESNITINVSESIAKKHGIE